MAYQPELEGIAPAYTLEVWHDTSDINDPRDADNLGTMVCFHRQYYLGDVRDSTKAAEPLRHWYYDNRPTLDPDEVHDLRNPRIVEELLEEKLGAIVLPLYMYDHSGVTISTSPFSCSWDSGQLGFIYVLPENIREWYGVKRITKKVRQRVINSLQSEVDEYDKYIRGEVFGFTLYDSRGEDIERCGGFFGRDWFENGMADYLPDEARHLLKDVEVEYE